MIELNKEPSYSVFPSGAEVKVTPEMLTNNKAYLCGADGIFLYKENELFKAIVDYKEEFEEIKESFEIKTSKIPVYLLREITDLFKEVYDKYSSEAIVLLTYINNVWGYVVPDQEVGCSSADYDNVPPGVYYGTIHSHAAMTAFHSSTDDKDEIEMEGIHLTIGKLDKYPMVDIACSAMVGKKRLKLEVEDLIASNGRKFTNKIKNITEYIPKSSFITQNTADLDTAEEFWEQYSGCRSMRSYNY